MAIDLETINNNVLSVLKRLDSLETNFDTLKNDLTAVTNKVNKIDEKFCAEVEALKARVVALDSNKQ